MCIYTQYYVVWVDAVVMYVGREWIGEEAVVMVTNQNIFRWVLFNILDKVHILTSSMA